MNTSMQQKLNGSFSLSNLQRQRFISIFKLSILVFCFLICAVVTKAQAPYFQSSAAAFTPLSEEPGAPAGSYPLSGFDNVNLYNGHLNFALPLMKIGGRGTAGYTMTLTIAQHWQVQTVAVPTCNQSGCSYPEGNFRYIANPIWWTGLRPGLGPGVMQGRQSGTSAGWLPNCSSYVYDKTLTRLTFTAPDGTETEFRDKQTNGQPLQGGGCNGGPSRGKVFVTADGSAATFVSDVDISDDRQAMAPDLIDVSGILMFRDGTRYRIDSGKVTWIRDVNGNKVSFTYFGNNVSSITDSLNRVVNFTSEGITFKGANGATRTIKVYQNSLSTALRKYPDGSPEYTIKTFAQLFSLQNPQNGTFDIPVTTAVELPDGRKYQFRYDSYANLAQVILPTGGRIDYDWTVSTYQFGQYGWGITTRVIERRTALSTTATNYETRTTYGLGADTTSGPTIATVNTLDPKNGNALLARSKHYFHGYWMAPPSSANPYPAWRDGREYQTELFGADGTTVLRRVDKTYQQRLVVGWWTGASTAAPPMDPRLVETLTTLVDSNQVAKTTAIDPANPTGPPGFDQYNNPTSVWEYDYGNGAPGALLRRTVTSYLTSGYDTLLPNSTSPNLSQTYHLRNRPSQISIYDGGGTERARVGLEYDNYANDTFHAPLVDRSNISGHDSAMSTSVTQRGNPTAVSSYLLPAGTAITAYSQYDKAGNVVKIIDPRSTAGNIISTTVSYDDNFGAPDNSLAERFTFTELGSQQTFAFPTQVTNPLNQSGFTQYDYYLGSGINQQGFNGTIVAAYHNDLLDRLTQFRRGIGTAAENQSTFEYDDVLHVISTKSDLNTYNDNLLVTKSIYDGMGRTIESQQYEGGTNYVKSQTEFDGAGRAFRRSNPFRPWLSETPVWTTMAFDALGRPTSVTTPDNAVATSSYLGNAATHTDQAGKVTKNVSDVFGRLTQVYEGPTGSSFLTTYEYDVLDNPTKVIQDNNPLQPQQPPRVFVYDSLKRITSAYNPESGTTLYEYDKASNLTQRTDSRGIVSTYTYDVLNRVKTVDYSDTATSPDVSRFYDGATNGVGKPWYSYAGGTESVGTTVEKTLIESYDALGRPLSMKQYFKTGGVWSSPYQVSRTYNLAGSVRQQTYPSTRAVVYNYDSAGRLGDTDPQNLAFTGNLGGVQRTYASGIIYEPTGQLRQEQLGTNTPVYNKLFYNSRLQLAEILASTTGGDTSWNRGKIINGFSLQCSGAGCNATDNNGNLRKQQVFVPADDQVSSSTSWYQQYDYDDLNRLLRVHEYTGNISLDWQQEYVYDQWGNRKIHQTNTFGNNIPKPNFGVNIANNRLTAPSGYSMSYDAAGNLTNDTYTGTGDRVYDANNKMTKAWANGQWQEYTYNADGNRTRRKVNGTETWQVYGFGAELVAEYSANGATASPQKEYGYRHGRLFITAEAPSGFNGYTNRRTITIDHNKVPNTDQSNFPVLIKGTYSYLATVSNGGNVQNANGYDVIFTSDSGCTTKLNHEVETYTASSGAVNYWVKVPLVSHTTDTTIYMCYGNSSITTDQSNKTAVWDTSFKAVYHLPDGSSLSASDSTANGNNGTKGTGAAAGAGNIGGAMSMTGVTNQHVAVTSNAGLRSGTITVSAWVKTSDGSLNRHAVTEDNNITRNWTLRHTSAGQFQFSTFNTSGTQTTTSSTTNFSLNTWHHIVGVFDGATGTAKLYADGANTATTTSLGTLNTGTIDLHIGQKSDNPPTSGFWYGLLDEVRYSNVARSSDWIATEYNNQSSPATFYTISTPSGGTAGVRWVVTDQLGTPRMVFDETGSLANVKRHDYLPFGEELAASQGLRNGTIGYSGVDGVRQKFTSYERDDETLLDYANARYYASGQGRFTSVDPLASSAHPDDPQSWNRYAYVLNNPLTMMDPTGMTTQTGDLDCTPSQKCLNKGEKPSGGDAPPCWPQCGLYPGQAPAINEVVTINDDAPKDTLTTTSTTATSLDTRATTNLVDPSSAPEDAPGDNWLERYASDPVQTGIEVVAWASEGLANVGYSLLPDYASANVSLPLVLGVEVAVSKDREVYYSVNIFGVTGGNFNWKNWKAGGGVSVAYFATTQMTPQERDDAIRGTSINVTGGPIGGNFQLTGGPPAVVFNFPATNIGVTVSQGLISTTEGWVKW